jgi:hypothetical protein
MHTPLAQSNRSCLLTAFGVDSLIGTSIAPGRDGIESGRGVQRRA